MNVPLAIAGVLAATVGIGHSWLGERWILIPLFRTENLPRTPIGDVRATRLMIRFTWHFFSVIAFSAAGLFLAYAAGVFGGDWTVVRVMAAYWAVFALVVLVQSRGRHGAWVLGSLVTAAAWWGTL